MGELFNITSFSIVIKPYTLARIAIYFQCHQHLPRAIYSRQGFFMICKYLSSLSSTRASWRQLKMQPKNEKICVEINSQVSHRTTKKTTTSFNCNGGFGEKTMVVQNQNISCDKTQCWFFISLWFIKNKFHKCVVMACVDCKYLTWRKKSQNLGGGRG